MLGIEISVGGNDGVETRREHGAGFGDALPALARRDRFGRLHRGRFRRSIGQGDDFFSRRSPRLARGVRIVWWPLPAGTLAEHAAQAQEDEYRQRQEYDGVDVEHVSHAFGNRNGRSTRGPIDGVAAGSTVTIYAGVRANP